jgi:hypothetical protein
MKNKHTAVGLLLKMENLNFTSTGGGKLLVAY